MKQNRRFSPAGPRAPWLAGLLAMPLLAVSPASAEPPADAAQQIDRDEPPPDPAGRAMLAAGLGPELASRSLAYKDKMTPNLRSYSVAGAPGVHGQIESFPLARGGGVAAGFGLRASGDLALGLTSDATEQSQVTTRWYRVDGALRYLAPLGERFALGLDVGGGREVFSFQEAIAQDRPNVKYTYLAAGPEAMLRAGSLRFVASGAYHHLLAFEGGPDRLRSPSVRGVEGSLGVHAPLHPRLEIALTGQYTRYFYAFAPTPGDPYVAGGALDQIARVRLDATATF